MAVPFSNTRLRVPRGFQNLLEGLAREVLRNQPDQIFEFGRTYFEKLLQIRDETGHDLAVHGSKLEDRFYNNDSFKKPAQVDVSNPQQQEAALAIQSQYRQHAAKQEVEAIRSQPPQEEVDIDLNDPEVGTAATKIQANFRGFQGRKQAQEIRGGVESSDQSDRTFSDVLDVDIVSVNTESMRSEDSSR